MFAVTSSFIQTDCSLVDECTIMKLGVTGNISHFYPTSTLCIIKIYILFVKINHDLCHHFRQEGRTQENFVQG